MTFLVLASLLIVSRAAAWSDAAVGWGIVLIGGLGAGLYPMFRDYARTGRWR